ncbi:flagellar biosynthesis protein FlhB [Microbulbifer thermotolerans]|uniref:Flagellar biosynthetic protein FlhB n=1 Tax=Microbulbifer thermotolerans TaxID=252514 RepID=A0AB35HYI8_MICTH|nr:flagellar biosynthesis protein FlhB [Microbulbifer thermotolerans]MCX2780092.1 flagellar biosynthesis protein FlhB [Microbulbifer thermotolerans]MCX2802118.1 flagellar biosynthesis protein FlhB [Microbulbifer thermotolerans]MCX2805516.1 flagellar biosynthesis protein FlhB [Microbulbifer thermotolerans]MCX2831957.1 flagellar biosynthesis protein FlhB [Microbulbifer thermotolerans]
MADETEDQEKTEAATPRRLQKAREEGQVARSRELATVMLLGAGVGGLWALGPHLFSRVGLVMEQSFLFERREAFDSTAMIASAADLGARMLTGLLPLFVLLAAVALAAPNLLGGFLISAKSLKPQFSKLNPIKGLKRQFSSQALAELAKAIAKSLLVGSVVAAFLMTRHGEFMALMDMPREQALAAALRLAAQACGLMVLSLIVVILIDVPYQLWSHAKKLRMSKEEIRREHKETEGDPQLKARIRQQQQAMARSRMMSKVPEADVIVTNPTHYAVALRYDETRMAAPRVVAKGVDAVAARIRELGAEHDVPLLEAPPLARALYRHVDLDREIPGQLYTAVAEVLVWAIRLRRARNGDGEFPETPADLPVPEEMEVTS